MHASQLLANPLAVRRGLARLGLALVTAGSLLPWLVVAPAAVAGAPPLTVTPLTWNTVGLDSNSPGSGPSVFPVGVRVCNNAATALTGVQTTFAWTTTNAYLALQGATTHALSDLAAGTCTDDYYQVMVSQVAAAFDATRGYTISASATGAGTVSTPTPRQLYVEHLLSQNRNGITSITGPASVTVGNRYTYTLTGFTATQGYGELQTFLTFPQNLFAVRSVTATYAVGGTNDRPWADACGWDEDPTSVNYNSCVGPTSFANGNAGGKPISMTTRLTPSAPAAPA